MATIIGTLRPEATAGEKTVLEWLRDLPDEVIVWPELAVRDSYPDFVILHPRLGIVVLEVKDWVEFVAANPDTITIRTRGGEQRAEPHPARATREKAFKVANKLEADGRLKHSDGLHRGKLRLPWEIAVVFPNISRMWAYQLGTAFEQCALICQDDLQQRSAAGVLADLPWRFPTDLSPDDIDIIRQVLYPNLVITHNNRPVGTADIAQELAALEGLHDVGSRPEEEELPEQGRAVAVNPAVRLVRGVVGSGKTLVLVMRAKNLADAYPDWRLLVVTFNRPLSDDLQTRFDGYEDRVTVTNFHRLCRRLLSGVNEWSGKPIDDRRGRIANIVNTQFEIPRLEADFLDEEIKWIKEMGLRDKARYMSEPRIGRGRPLGQADREFVWAVYERYQSMLADFHRFDWEDVPLMVLKAMEYGMLRGQAYDAILIDEAQDFAPAWFEVLRRQLNPQTAVMFLSADGVQRIYRKHSWRSLGLNVVGRTRILNRSYRSTYEIARVAVHLLRSDADVMSALEAEGEELPPTQLDPAWMRHGEPPELRFFPNGRKEKQWIENRLRALLGQGYRPDDIALFHYTKDGRNGLAAAVQQAGLPVRVLSGNSPPVPGAITVGTMHAAKGLEFRVVLLPQLQALFFGGRMPTTVEQATREQAEKLRLLYVALTRARELLYMSYEKALPPNLNAFVSFVRDQSREVGSV